GSVFFFFSSRRRHTRFSRDWSSDVCSSDLTARHRARRSACHNPFERGSAAKPIDELDGEPCHLPRTRRDERLDAREGGIAALNEIGRASCRERVEVVVGGGDVGEKSKRVSV